VIWQPSAAIRVTAIQWSRAFLDILFPPTCVGCGEPGTDWCDRCDQNLNRLSGPTCNRCGSPLHQPQMVCNRCVDFPKILRVRSYAYYEGPLLRAILHLKYRPNKRLAEVMGNWLVDLVIQEGIEADQVVAVPLGKNRLKQRGYNQVELITNHIAKRLDLRSDKKALKRIRETKSQVGLDPVKRRVNVRNAFWASQEIIKGQRVLLVDDLFTTGSTLLDCTRALQEVGVKKVFGLTVARA
jgi:competence protein ComFC